MTHVPIKRAFVFLNVEVKKLNNIVEELIEFKEIKEVHIVTGAKDLLAVIEAEVSPVRQSEEIIDFVVNKIGKLKGVIDTDTIIPTKSRYKW
jgi:DNA-binding Lrp family transcriptional regulator